ncbi:DUF3039 domain-containing protein [Kribbella sp. NBC_01505]|uniref:DUF3039 domain-containing protein n=1 Tax=Kribbella sp. NBC_01505 TaxID=2903580 RepID=UPI00386DF307
MEVHHPVSTEKKIAEIDLTVGVVRDDGYEADEIALEIMAAQGFVGSELIWQLTTRVLVALSPPVQGWDRYKDTYSNIAEPGAWTARVAKLSALVDANELEDPEPGRTSHYVHTKHLAGNTIEGRAVRAMCGIYFVPMQDHEAKPKCAECSTRFAALPG